MAIKSKLQSATAEVQSVRAFAMTHMARKTSDGGELLNRKLKAYAPPQRRMIKALSLLRGQTYRVADHFGSETENQLSSATADGHNVKPPAETGMAMKG